MKQCRAGTGKLSLMQSADSGVYSARAYRAAETSGCWRDRVKRRFVWHHTIISQSPLTRTRRNARARSTNIQHIPEHRTITHTHSLTSRLHIGGQSVCFCGWLSHIAQRHCVIEEPLGFRVWVPLWLILTNRTVTAEAEVLLPVHQEYFCLKPESLKYWFVLLACFKAG